MFNLIMDMMGPNFATAPLPERLLFIGIGGTVVMMLVRGLFDIIHDFGGRNR